MEKAAMLAVTENAQKQISVFLEGKRIKSVRIMKTDACPGPRLELGLDEVTDEDSVFEVAGTTYMVEKNLLSQVRSINIDFTGQEFEISSSQDLGPQCSGCGTPDSRCGH